MKKFVFEYYKENAAEKTPPEAMDAINKWFGSLGENLVDGGNPFGLDGMAVEKSGASKIENYPCSGYSIVLAENMDAAVEMAKSSPILNSKGGTVRIYEALPM